MANTTQGWPSDRIYAANTKHELTRKQVQEYLADLIDHHANDVVRATWGEVRGILPIGVTPLTLSAGGVNDSIAVSDGLGILLNATDDWPPYVDYDSPGNVDVGNALGVTYYVGLRLQQVPIPTADGVRANTRSFGVDYVAYRMEIGELGHPDSVTDNGDGTVSMQCVSVVAAGGGANDVGDVTIRSWLDTPVDPDSTIAFQTEKNVPLGGPGSRYETTVNDFGQTVRTGSISTDVNDYWVFMDRVTVTRTDISADTDYVYLGSYVGAGNGNPIGAVDATTNVVRFGALPGTNALNIDQLAADLYTVPSLDGDGLANLATPIETQVATERSRIDQYDSLIAASCSVGLLKVPYAASGRPPIRESATVPSPEYTVIPMDFFTGLPASYVASTTGQNVTPPINQTSIITVDPVNGTFQHYDVSTPDWPGLDEVVIGVVKKGAVNIDWLQWFPQRANFGAVTPRVQGMRVDTEEAVACTSIRILPGRIFTKGREWVMPLACEFAHSDVDFWSDGTPVAAAGWRYFYAYADVHANLNRVYYEIQPSANDAAPPGPDGVYNALATATAHGRIYLGAMYWTGAQFRKDYHVDDKFVLLSNPESVLAAGNSAVTAAINIAAEVPLTTSAVLVEARVDNNAGDNTRAFLGGDSASITAGSASDYMEVQINGAAAVPQTASDFVQRWIPLKSPQTLFYKIAAGNGTLDVRVVGYIDDRDNPMPSQGGSYTNVTITLPN